MKTALKQSMQRKEPRWLTDYRERQSDYAKAMQPSVAVEENPAHWIENESPAWSESGWKILSWKQALAEAPQLVQQAIDQEMPPQNAEEAITNALFNQGFVAIAPKELKKRELHSFSLKNAGGYWKSLIVIPENAESPKIFFGFQNTEPLHWSESVWLKEGSGLFCARMVESVAKTGISQQWVVGKDAKAQNGNAWLNAGEALASTQFRLGEGSHSEQLEACLLEKSASLDGSLLQFHDQPNAASYSVIKSVARDASRIQWNGMIRVPKSGKQSNAMLESHSLLDGEKARCNQVPSLEIESDDVKAFHSASVSQLNEEHLYYLRSRGLAESEAKRLVVRGFLESVWNRLPIDYQANFSQKLQSH